MKKPLLIALVLTTSFVAVAQQTPVPDNLTFTLATEKDPVKRFQAYRKIIWHYFGKSELKAVPPI
jgi:hypothetical protein